MNFIPSDRAIWLYCQTYDLRYGSRYLLMQARNSCADFDYNGFYVFTNSRYTLIKILWMEGSSICMCVRRLKKGTYRWPKKEKTLWTRYSQPDFLVLLTDLREHKRKTLRDLLKISL